ncbi:MAG TPA: enolase C-terminal domain-like protein, partial [Anaerolineaceae bacterium]
YQLLDLPEPQPLLTSFTVAIAAPEEMARIAREASAFAIIKIKLGSEDDETRVAAVRAARPDARLFVDANAGWSLPDALRHVEALERYDIELVEQPVAKDDIAGMGTVQAHTALPVVADESAQTYENVERLAAAGVRGINLKLMKLGGLTPAVRIARRARELGMRVMLGSMIETSIGVTAMSHLMGLAEWLDLDSPLLISNDPFRGIRYDPDGCVRSPGLPGIGVEKRPAGEVL